MALLACSASGTSNSVTADAGGPSASSGNPDSLASCVSDDTMMRCNSLVPGSVVTGTCGHGDQPKPSGGTIAEGTYHLTAQTDHGSYCLSQTRHAVAGTIVYRAGVLNEVVDSDPLCTQDAGSGDSPQRQRFTSTITTDGVAFKAQETCRSFNSDTLTSYSINFTATATTLTLVNRTSVTTYTLVP